MINIQSNHMPMSIIQLAYRQSWILRDIDQNNPSIDWLNMDGYLSIIQSIIFLAILPCVFVRSL